jgi:hypothetical protein
MNEAEYQSGIVLLVGSSISFGVQTLAVTGPICDMIKDTEVLANDWVFLLIKAPVAQMCPVTASVCSPNEILYLTSKTIPDWY